MKSNEKIKILTDVCVGCILCAKVCPFQAISIKDNKAVIDYTLCNLCGACVNVCKFNAIEIKTIERSYDFSSYKDIWVFCEQKKGVIQPVVYELLGEGSKLASKRHSKLCAVVLGENMKEKVEPLFGYGADIVYLVDSPYLKYYQDDPYANVLVRLINEYKPEIVLCGATTIGRSLISKVLLR